MKIITVIIFFIVFFILFFYLYQRSIIYLPDKAKPQLKPLTNTNIKEVILQTADGLALLSWYQPARDGKPTLYYFQGNAGNIGSRSEIILPYLQQGYGVLLLGYRGYGSNLGSPSEKGLYQDMWAGWNFLQKKGISGKCIVLYGESLGTGLAIELAKQREVGAVILLSPYTSLTDLGSYHYPFLPVGLILKDRFDSFAKISLVKSPLLILIAENDVIVPAKLSRRIYEAANPPKQLIVYNIIDHNTLLNISQKKIIGFLTEHGICKN